MNGIGAPGYRWVLSPPVSRYDLATGEVLTASFWARSAGGWFRSTFTSAITENPDLRGWWLRFSLPRDRTFQIDIAGVRREKSNSASDLELYLI